MSAKKMTLKFLVSPIHMIRTICKESYGAQIVILMNERVVPTPGTYPHV